MNAGTGRHATALLVPMLRRWQGLLRAGNPQAPAKVRISSGSAYITPSRAAKIDAVVGQLLGLCQPYLIHADLAVPVSMLRAKILVEIRWPYAGLLIRLRYHGDAPTLDHATWVRRELGSNAILLDAAARDRAVTLGALIAEPDRELALIHVRAGSQALALPMATVAKALPGGEDGSASFAGTQLSLAGCLGLDAPDRGVRPACLLVKTPLGLQPLQVEALEGHGRAVVMPPGPLFLALPWCQGFFIDSDGAAPVPVLDPWPLFKAVEAGRDPSAV